MVLMAWRRIVSFVSLLTAGKTITFEFPEYIALIISVLMLMGVVRIGAYFRSIRTAEEKSEQAEKDLRKSAAKFREISSQFHALLDAIPDSITLHSSDLKVLWANNSAAWLNKNPEEVVGSYCYELWHNRTVPCEPCPVLKSFSTGEPAIETITKHDSRIWEIRTIPITEDGSVVNVIEVGRDITERKRAEETIQLQLKRLNTLRSIEKAITPALTCALPLTCCLIRLPHNWV